MCTKNRRRNKRFILFILNRVRISFHRKDTFAIFLTSYLAILIIPLIIGSLFYQVTTVSLEQSLVESQQKAIVSMRYRIDQKFREVKQMTSQLAFDSGVVTLQTALNPLEKGNVVEAYNELFRKMAGYLAQRIPW